MRSDYQIGVELNYSSNKINDTLALAMPCRPDFEVLKAVVSAVAIDVVNGFLGIESTSEARFNDEAVLHVISLRLSIPQQNVSVLVRCFSRR